MKKEKEAASAAIGDFSRQAVSKSVFHNTLQHPLTLYPFVVGVLGVAATLTLDLSFPVLLGSLSALGGSAMSWIVNYFFRGEVFARRHIEERQRALESHRRQLLATMQVELMQCRSITGAEELSWQGIEQLDHIQKRFTTLKEILSDKLDRGELIYSRYLGVAEQVYLSVLDNLKDLIPILKGAGAIDTGYVSQRLNELRRLENPTGADLEEVATLTQRMSLRDRQLQKASVLLTRNEEAMTHMDDAIAAIANMDTDKARASLTMESAIEELQRLARVTQQFK